MRSSLRPTSAAIALFLLLPALAALARGAGRQTSNAAPAAAQDTPPEERGLIDEGRRLYVSYGCYQCHGYEAQGSSATGPRLGPPAPPYDAFSAYVRRPAGQMPPYTTRVLAEEDLRKIHAYVRSRPAPPPLEQIPLLSR